MAKQKWIQAAHLEKGALHRALNIQEGKNIPAKKLSKAANAPGRLGKMARAAQTLRKLGNR